MEHQTPPSPESSTEDSTARLSVRQAGPFASSLGQSNYGTFLIKADLRGNEPDSGAVRCRFLQEVRGGPVLFIFLRTEGHFLAPFMSIAVMCILMPEANHADPSNSMRVGRCWLPTITVVFFESHSFPNVVAGLLLQNGQLVVLTAYSIRHATLNFAKVR